MTTSLGMHERQREPQILGLISLRSSKAHEDALAALETNSDSENMSGSLRDTYTHTASEA